jgi:hypothetical protein
MNEISEEYRPSKSTKRKGDGPMERNKDNPD